MNLMTIKSKSHGDATVRVVRETAKAIQVEGNASQAWFPKSAISSDGEIAAWFSFGLEHFFLFDSPFTGAEYEPAVLPRDCAMGGEEDSNWT